jgi:hypothetical protein
LAVFFDFIAGNLDIASKAGLKDSIKKSGKGTNHNQDFKANDKVNDDRTV